MKSGGPGCREKAFEFICDTQDIIISVLRFSMRDIPVDESISYALGKIIGAPFLPFGSGNVLLAGGGGFHSAAEVNMTENLRKVSRPSSGRAFSEGCAAPVECGAGGRVFCRAPVVCGGKTLGVLNLFFRDGRYSLTAAEEKFVWAASSVIAEILARKAAEEEAAGIRRELQSAKRLADIGELAASVAHELRSPLSVIKIAALNIGRKYGGEKALKKHIASIEKKIFECDRIISNLLFYARLREPEFEKVNLYDIILETIGETSSLPGPGVKVRRNLRPVKNVYVRIDPVQMKEVFSNILLNSFESMAGGGGCVTVSSHVGGDGRPVVVIGDTGGGMKKADMRKIFTPFWTTKARGNGLGLTVAQSIMRMHGGRIEAESARGKGSVFRLFLPRAEEDGGR